MLVSHCTLERRQAIIEIGIQPFPLTIPAVGSGIQFPQIPITSYRALIDTGAQRTCLTNSVITNHGLVRHGHKHIRNVHSEATHSLFMALIGIWAVDSHDTLAKERTRSYFGIESPFEVINISDNENFDAILGMDVLENYSFQFSKEQEFTLQLS